MAGERAAETPLEPGSDGEWGPFRAKPDASTSSA